MLKRKMVVRWALVTGRMCGVNAAASAALWFQRRRLISGLEGQGLHVRVQGVLHWKAW